MQNINFNNTQTEEIDKNIKLKNKECFICFELLEFEIVKLLCGHEMHFSCLQDWMTQKNNVLITCPYCQQETECVTVYNINDNINDDLIKIKVNAWDSNLYKNNVKRRNITRNITRNYTNKSGCCCIL